MRLITDDRLATITIWQEARNQSQSGKIAIGEVIRRRAALKYNSDGTIAGTVARRYQFSGWNTDDPNRIPSLALDDSDPIVHDCMTAWYKSEHTNITNGAVLYCNLAALKKRPTWARDDKQVAVIDDHTFFVD